jgi:flagellar assembly protein FliH
LEELPALAAAGGAGGLRPRPATEAATRSAGAETGRQQGFGEARAKFEEQLARERAAVAKALGDFSRERAPTTRRWKRGGAAGVEHCAQGMHREAQVDPLLLMGIVRVALERIEGATGVVLRGASQNRPGVAPLSLRASSPEDLPEIVEDAAQCAGALRVADSMGTAELGTGSAAQRN